MTSLCLSILTAADSYVSVVKVRKEFSDLTQITDKNTIIDKIFKIDDKSYQYVGNFLHNLLEKYKEEFDRITIVNRILQAELSTFNLKINSFCFFFG